LLINVVKSRGYVYFRRYILSLPNCRGGMSIKGVMFISECRVATICCRSMREAQKCLDLNQLMLNLITVPTHVERHRSIRLSF
jgi:hypothetical protein